MGMNKDNQIVTLQRRENSLKLLTSHLFSMEKRWLKVILIDIYVIAKDMVRVNGELLFSVFTSQWQCNIQ